MLITTTDNISGYIARAAEAPRPGTSLNAWTGAGLTASTATGAATPLAVMLTSSAASISAATPAAGTMEMDVYPDGDVKLVSGGVTIAALEVDSDGGNLQPAGWSSLTEQLSLTDWTASSDPYGVADFLPVHLGSALSEPVTLDVGTAIDYGPILPPGFTDGSDLTFTYNLVLDASTGRTANQQGNIVFVPEPAGLGLIGLAAVGLLRRHRRRGRR